MNYTKRLIGTFVFASALVTSSVFLNTFIAQARPSARTIMNAGEAVTDWFRRNSDDINISVPKKIKVKGKTVTGVYNRLVQDRNGQVYCLGQAQYSDGSYSEPYYSESSSCSQ